MRFFAPETTIRVRILWTIVLVAVAALGATGSLVAVLQANQVQEDVDAGLGRIRDELRVLATDGTDPATGAAFTTPESVLVAYLEGAVMEAGHSQIAYVGTHLKWGAPASVSLRPENDSELLAAISEWILGPDTVIDTVSTQVGTYRVMVVPIVAGQATGALVHVVDMGVAMAGLRSTMITAFAVGVVTIVVVAALAHFMVSRLLRPIEELRGATESIDESDLTSRVTVRGRDDLAALAESFNRMLDRVHEASQAQLRLLDDVGHELRTPVTVLRGHLELLDPEDPEDVRQTRDLLLDEAGRMGTLVEDILMLAKASASDFVRPTPTEVADLTDQVFEKARALGDRAWHLDETADVVTTVDSGRITQAWLQLAANAVKYSAPGTRVDIGSALVDSEVRMWVRDQGIGIAEQDIDAIRQRFSRTRSAARLAPGSGLGLSIVESIMRAHGGRLDIVSTEGVGSLFTLCLPHAVPTDTDEDTPASPSSHEPRS